MTRLRPGGKRVSVGYLGHSAVLLTTPTGLRVAIDPYGNPSGSEARWFVRPCPRVSCDVLLITHPHFDHDAIDRVDERPTILRGPLELRGHGLRIRGVMSRHARHFGEGFGQQNIIFVIETAGITFCHLGDSCADLPPRTLEAVGRVDVLIVPVDDSQHLLTHADVDRLVFRLAPKIVIPVTTSFQGSLIPRHPSRASIDGYETQSNIRRLDAGHFWMSKDELPVQGAVWLFGNYAAGENADRFSGRSKGVVTPADPSR